MKSCEVCGIPSFHAAEHPSGACDDCVRLLGTHVVSPPRRRRKPCSCCNHDVLIRAHPLQHALVATLAVERGKKGGMTVSPRGRLEAYICRACGFVEWYCDDPTAIPIGPAYMTELIENGPDTPYR